VFAAAGTEQENVHESGQIREFKAKSVA